MKPRDLKSIICIPPGLPHQRPSDTRKQFPKLRLKTRGRAGFYWWEIWDADTKILNTGGPYPTRRSARITGASFYYERLSEMNHVNNETT